MDAQIKLLKTGWKAGLMFLVVISLVFGGLFLSLRNALAGNPNLTLLYLGVNNTNPVGWAHSVTLNHGEQVKFYAEIHNTNVPSTANNVKIKVTLPGGSVTDGTSTATASADNANSVSDNVALHINGSGQLQYVAGSTAMTWDVNGDGNLEYNGTQMPDGIVDNGLVLGNQQGCNQYVIQISFKANVVGQPQSSPSPTPSPSPSPSVSPSPSPTPCTTCGGNDIDIDIENNQTQTQTVNVTSPVTTAAVPAKQPETGAGVLGLATMFSAAPIGLALSRYGRGRVVTGKKEENLAGIAKGLVESRHGKNTQV